MTGSFLLEGNAVLGGECYFRGVAVGTTGEWLPASGVLGLVSGPRLNCALFVGALVTPNALRKQCLAPLFGGDHGFGTEHYRTMVSEHYGGIGGVFGVVSGPQSNYLLCARPL